jgi:hypothetical protein
VHPSINDKQDNCNSLIKIIPAIYRLTPCSIIKFTEKVQDRNIDEAEIGKRYLGYTMDRQPSAIFINKILCYP